MVGIGWYNTIRFGIFYEDGHAADLAVKLINPFIVGFCGQLMSPGKGLFFFSPILLFSCFGMKTLYKSHRWESVLIVGIILVNLLFYSKLVNWSGDWCWGPRFTVPIIPFMAVLLGAVLGTGFLRRKTGFRKVWIALLFLSLVVQMLGVSVDGARRIGRRYRSNAVTPTHVYWHPAASPLVDHLNLFIHLSFNPTQVSSVDSFEVEEISYDDTTADFWFVYLYSLGFPLKWIAICMGILIILTIYFGFSIVGTMYQRVESEC